MAKQKERDCWAAALSAQVPSVASLPCSAANLLDGVLAKAAPELVGTPEGEQSKRVIDLLLQKSAVECAKPVESERLDKAAADAAQAEAEHLAAGLETGDRAQCPHPRCGDGYGRGGR